MHEPQVPRSASVLNLEISTTESHSDELLVRRILAGEVACFELIMRRNNQRVYRAVRAIVGSDDEAQDVMQEAYVNAYTHLADFAGRSRFSTWRSEEHTSELQSHVKLV